MDVNEFGFFNGIRTSYSNDVVSVMKRILNVTQTLASLHNRKIFLLKCRMKSIFPAHIINNIKCIYSLQVEDHPYVRQAEGILFTFRKNILNLEIKITFFRIHCFENEITHLFYLLRNKVDTHLFLEFKSRVQKKHDKIFLRKFILKKLSLLQIICTTRKAFEI